ncbi:hypothetical protein Ami103574_04490 [Aminipila butyrica]|uniref:Uncharacterized protein n=1 Tax=Aminipila butyrica TaxID=433296 RepID=A0A858BRQ3_9FIRM|nr:DUF6711 family protein [Aminipila butyrica]QIB68621.1 hypothetical protein Ami103574_04490 [Aminipila butyrica]
MLKIKGIDMPTPSELKVGIQDLSKAERAANGQMFIERVATKRKLEPTWQYLSNDDLSRLFQAVSGVFFQVEYIDPQDNAKKTGTFYAGDRKAGALDYRNGVIRYKDISVSLVER